MRESWRTRAERFATPKKVCYLSKRVWKSCPSQLGILALSSVPNRRSSQKLLRRWRTNEFLVDSCLGECKPLQKEPFSLVSDRILSWKSITCFFNNCTNSRIIGAASFTPLWSVSRKVGTVSNFSASSALVIHIQVVNKATSSVGNWSFRYKSCFDTSRFDTNSSSEIAQKFRLLQVQFAHEKNLVENSSFSKPRKRKYLHLG